MHSAFTGAAVGVTKFIGRHRLEAHRGCSEPRIDIKYCVPGNSINFEKNLGIALRMGFARRNIFQTVDRMIKEVREKIHFGVVNSPNYLHRKHGLAFAGAGIPTICDKPLAHTLKAAADLESAFSSGGISSAITPTYCFFSANLEARQRIALAGKGEQVMGGVFQYPQHWLDQPLEKIAPEAGLDQATWRKDPNSNGEAGATGDIWSHLMFLLNWITGQKTIEIRAMRKWMVTGNHQTETDDGIISVVRLENGTDIPLLANQFAGASDNRISWELYLREGQRFSWQMARPEILMHCPAGERAAHELQPSSFASPILGATNSMPGMHAGDGWKKAEERILRSFLAQAYDDHSLIGGLEPFHLDFSDGLNIQRCIEAAVGSSDKDMQPVVVDWK